MNAQQQKNPWLMPVVAIVALLLMVLAMAGAFNDKIEPETLSVTPEEAAGGYKVGLTSIKGFESLPASVEAKQDTLISSRIVAQILQVNVRAGDTVKKGQLLLKLEQDDLRARLDQAQENIGAVTARLAEAENNFKRVKQLHSQKLISDADLDKSLAGRDTLRAELAQAKQGLVEARASLGFADIRSPISGRVVDRFAEPGDTAQMGQKLLSIYDPLSLRIEAWVREDLAVNLEVGQQLSVEIPSVSDKLLTADVEEVVPAADPGSRSFLVKARIGFDQQLMPGIYARVRVPVEARQGILIPETYLVQTGQLQHVWVLENDQRTRRYVRVGRADGEGKVEILSGLEVGDVLLP